MQDNIQTPEVIQNPSERLIFENTPTISELRVNLGLSETIDLESQVQPVAEMYETAIHEFKNKFRLERTPREKLTIEIVEKRKIDALELKNNTSSSKHYGESIKEYDNVRNKTKSYLESIQISTPEEILSIFEMQFMRGQNIGEECYDLINLFEKIYQANPSILDKIKNIQDIRKSYTRFIELTGNIHSDSSLKEAASLVGFLEKLDKIPENVYSKNLQELKKYNFILEEYHYQIHDNYEIGFIINMLENSDNINHVNLEACSRLFDLGQFSDYLFLLLGENTVGDFEAVANSYIYAIIKNKISEEDWTREYGRRSALKDLNKFWFKNFAYPSSIIGKKELAYLSRFGFKIWNAEKYSIHLSHEIKDFEKISHLIKSNTPESLNYMILSEDDYLKIGDYSMTLLNADNQERFLKFAGLCMKYIPDAEERVDALNFFNEYLNDLDKYRINLDTKAFNILLETNLDESDHFLLKLMINLTTRDNGPISRDILDSNTWPQLMRYLASNYLLDKWRLMNYASEKDLINDIETMLLPKLSSPEQKYWKLWMQLPEDIRSEFLEWIDIKHLNENENIESILEKYQVRMQLVSKIFARLNSSKSKEIKKFQSQILSLVLNSDNPEISLEQINSVFEKNNLPEMAKIYRVFEILYPKENISNTLRNKSLSPVLTDAGEKRRYDIFYRDLLKVHIDSGNSSLYKYLLTLKDGQYLVDKVSSSGLESLSKDTEFPQLIRFLNRMDTLLENSLYGRRSGYRSQKSTNILERIENLRTSYGLKSGENFTERVADMFVKPVGYTSINGVLARMDSVKKSAHERNIEFVRNLSTNNIFSQGSLLKGVDSNFMELQFQNGIVAKEFLGADAGSDATPFDTDFDRIDEKFSLDNSYADRYGDVAILIRDRGQFQVTKQEKQEKAVYDLGKYELFYSGVVGERHFGVRTGIASTEIDAIVNLTNDPKYLERIYFSIAQNGFYIPVLDKDGKLLFTPEMYDAYQISGETLSVYFKNETRTPEGLTQALKKVPYLAQLFESNVGVWEGYTLEEHTKMVLGQYEKYFAGRWKSPLISEDNFRILLALHDLGKPLAVKMTNDNNNQHEYTMRFLPKIIEKLGINVKESELITAMVSGDYLGQFLQGKADLETTGRLINIRAKEAGVPVDQFFELLKMYFMCDAGSYTTNAGGKEALDNLFVFQPEKFSVQLSGDVQNKLNKLSPYLFLE